MPTNLFKKGQIPWNKNTQVIECQKCGKKIEVSPSRVGVQKFCSRRCSLLGTKRHLGFKHSSEVREKIRDNTPVRYGSENNKWKGGITPLYNQIRNCPKYALWRKEIYERDDYTCGMCWSRKSGTLNAHHLMPLYVIVKRFEIKTLEKALSCDFLWDISNGVTLCKNCHDKTKYDTNNYEKLRQNNLTQNNYGTI